jgi:hypothetical protein
VRTLAPYNFSHSVTFGTRLWVVAAVLQPPRTTTARTLDDIVMTPFPSYFRIGVNAPLVPGEEHVLPA